MRSLPWNEGVVKAETCTAARTAEIRAAFENIVNVRSVGVKKSVWLSRIELDFVGERNELTKSFGGREEERK